MEHKTISFDGSQDFLTAPDQDFDFGDGDFTIDFYVDKNGFPIMPRDPYILRDCIRDVLKRKESENVVL